MDYSYSMNDYDYNRPVKIINHGGKSYNNVVMDRIKILTDLKKNLVNNVSSELLY